MASAASSLTTYDPGQVMLSTGLGKEDRPGAYLSTSGTPTLGAEAVRATGTGPFDAAYRQNIATYAGGQLYRPGGYLGFNPTSSDPFNTGLGAGGSQTGMPQSLINYAMGGQPFAWGDPNAAAASTDAGSLFGSYGYGGGDQSQNAGYRQNNNYGLVL